VGTDNRRFLYAIVASMVIVFGWQYLNPPPKPKPAVASANSLAQGPVAPGTAAPAAPAAGAPAVAPVVEAPEELVTLKGTEFAVVLSSHGGAIAHVELAGQKFQHAVDGKLLPIDMVRVFKGMPLPLAVAVSPELGGGADPLLDPATRSSMRVVSRDATSVVFEGRTGGVALKKSFRLTGKPYEVAVELELSGAPAAGTVSVLFDGYMPPSTSSGGIFSGPPLDFVRPVCRAGKKTERFDVAGDEVKKKLEGAVLWAGIDQHYFTAALLPVDLGGTCLFLKGGEKGSGAVVIQYPLDPGGKKLAFTLFAGPKQLELLKAYDNFGGTDRGFASAIDYGPVSNFFAFFAQILLGVMRWFHGFVGNWGVAIILLTLTVKLLLYPLTLKSMQSMNAMRRLQPEIEKLKAKHGEDREAMSRAQMALFQQHKVNPAGGCLPMLLQMPIWFALYAALQTSVELYREPFLWMMDLTQKDPFYILPVAMGATSFVMQKFSPQPSDNTQAKMMLYFFPGFFTVMMLFVPSGLTLYIFVNNLLSIGQQQLVNRMSDKALAPKA
jgi:YidC/Oxa1 family membrane protein insertase